MERKRHKPEQIVAILREAERGGTTADVCRKYGISEQTFYRWKRMYGGLGLSEVQKTKRLFVKHRPLIGSIPHPPSLRMRFRQCSFPGSRWIPIFAISRARSSLPTFK